MVETAFSSSERYIAVKGTATVVEQKRKQLTLELIPPVLKFITSTIFLTRITANSIAFLSDGVVTKAEVIDYDVYLYMLDVYSDLGQNLLFTDWNGKKDYGL